MNYDFDGNLTNDSVFVYSYDAQNRLVSVSSNDVVLVVNEYDSKSRRVRKITQEATTTFCYDDWNLIEERIAHTNGTTSTIHYYWGKDLSGTLQGAGGVGGLLCLTVDGAIYIPCYDNLGNITCYLDENGNTAAQYAYDAFGKIIVKSGPLADLFRHRFSTKYFDAETGLYYYGYRFYHPVLMRWLNRDPVGEYGGLHLYEFAQNIPLCYYDALGNRASKSFAQYEFLPKYCELRVKLDWYIKFVNVIGNGRWTKQDKAEWMLKVKFVVEEYFNSIPLRCSKYGKCCHCKNGIRVSFKLNFVGEEVSFKDWLFGFTYNNLVEVYKHPNSSSFVLDNYGTTYLNEDDGDGGKQQITVVHEVGHQLGLNHPGMWKDIRPNTPADYDASYEGLPGAYNLMGHGMVLHEDDFNRAFCSHINYNDCDK